METAKSFSEPPKDDDILSPPSEPPKMEEINLPVLAGQAPAKLTKDEALVAAQECGLGQLEVGKWGNYAVVGQYLQELGAIKVAAGKFAFNNKQRYDVMRICRRAMRMTKDPEMIAKLAEQINKLLDSSDSTLKELLKFVHTGKIQEPQDQPRLQLPPRGTPIVAVQVNNKVGGRDDEE